MCRLFIGRCTALICVVCGVQMVCPTKVTFSDFEQALRGRDPDAARKCLSDNQNLVYQSDYEPGREGMLPIHLVAGTSRHQVKRHKKVGDKESKRNLSSENHPWTPVVDAILELAPETIHKRDKKGRTPIFYVTDPHMLAHLCQQAADLDVRDQDGNTPFMAACCPPVWFPRLSEPLIEEWRARGGSFATKNIYGRTALLRAVEWPLYPGVPFLASRTSGLVKDTVREWMPVVQKRVEVPAMPWYRILARESCYHGRSRQRAEQSMLERADFHAIRTHLAKALWSSSGREPHGPVEMTAERFCSYVCARYAINAAVVSMRTLLAYGMDPAFLSECIDVCHMIDASGVGKCDDLHVSKLTQFSPKKAAHMVELCIGEQGDSGHTLYKALSGTADTKMLASMEFPNKHAATLHLFHRILALRWGTDKGKNDPYVQNSDVLVKRLHACRKAWQDSQINSAWQAFDWLTRCALSPRDAHAVLRAMACGKQDAKGGEGTDQRRTDAVQRAREIAALWKLLRIHVAGHYHRGLFFALRNRLLFYGFLGGRRCNKETDISPYCALPYDVFVGACEPFLYEGDEIFAWKNTCATGDTQGK